MKELKKKSKIKGIHYLSISVGSFKYLKIIHEKSNKSIINFTSSPVNGITKVILLSEKILSVAKWDIPEDFFNNKNIESVKKLKDSIILEDGKYTVRGK